MSGLIDFVSHCYTADCCFAHFERLHFGLEKIALLHRSYFQHCCIASVLIHFCYLLRKAKEEDTQGFRLEIAQD